MGIKEVFLDLNTSESGLSATEAQKCLETRGPNEIRRIQKVTLFQIFVRQFTSFIVVILLTAIAISLAIGERLDAIVIGIIVILNGIFGFIQEYKAEKAIGTLSLFYAYGIDSAKAKSIAFTTLVFFQLFNVPTYRAKDFRVEAGTSMFVLGAVLISVILQLAVLYTPLSIAFKTVPLGLWDWVLVLLVSSTLYVILKSRKMLMSCLRSKNGA